MAVTAFSMTIFPVTSAVIFLASAMVSKASKMVFKASGMIYRTSATVPRTSATTTQHMKVVMCPWVIQCVSATVLMMSHMEMKILRPAVGLAAVLTAVGVWAAGTAAVVVVAAVVVTNSVTGVAVSMRRWCTAVTGGVMRGAVAAVTVAVVVV